MNIEIPVFEEYIFHEKKTKYCLLIPLLNEGERFLKQLDAMKAERLLDLADVIICDAGSTDGSTDHQLLSDAGISALLVRKGKGRYSTDLRMGYFWALQRGYAGLLPWMETARMIRARCPFLFRNWTRGTTIYRAPDLLKAAGLSIRR